MQLLIGAVGVKKGVGKSSRSPYSLLTWQLNKSERGRRPWGKEFLVGEGGGSCNGIFES